jgi:hypothetical protein
VPVLALLFEDEGVAQMVVRRIMGVRPVQDDSSGAEKRTFLLRGVLNSGMEMTSAAPSAAWASLLGCMPALLRRGRRRASGRSSWAVISASMMALVLPSSEPFFGQLVAEMRKDDNGKDVMEGNKDE